MRAKTKEETVKKKRLKFEHIPIQEVIQDRELNIQQHYSDGGGNESEEYVKREDGELTVLNPSKTKGLKLKEV